MSVSPRLEALTVSRRYICWFHRPVKVERLQVVVALEHSGLDAGDSVPAQVKHPQRRQRGSRHCHGRDVAHVVAGQVELGQPRCAVESVRVQPVQPGEPHVEHLERRHAGEGGGVDAAELRVREVIVAEVERLERVEAVEGANGQGPHAVVAELQRAQRPQVWDRFWNLSTKKRNCPSLKHFL